MARDRELVTMYPNSIAEKDDDLELWDFLYPQDAEGPDEE